MAPQNHQFFLFTLLISLLIRVRSFDVFIKSTVIYPFSCSNHIQTCNSYLYHISKGLQMEQIASFYSVNTTQLKPITHGTEQDYLVSVPCTCRDVNGTQGYFYDTFYEVQSGDKFENVMVEFYSGQALKVAGEEELFVAGNMVTIHLVCGCVERESQEVVTYTVQEDDNLSEIAVLLSAELEGIESMNGRLTQNPNFIDTGWVLFVPMEKRGTQGHKQGKRISWTMIIGILSAVTLFSVGTMLYLLRRNRTQENREEDPKAVSKTLSAKRTSLQNHLLNAVSTGCRFRTGKAHRTIK